MKKRLQALSVLLGDPLTLGQGGFSLRLRLFSFLAFFIMLLMLAILLLLYATGVFSLGQAEIQSFLERELTHMVSNVDKSNGTLAVEGVTLSQRLSDQAERELTAAGVSPATLKQHPQLLEDVLRSCIDPLIASLEKNSASAVFVILDATVNPSLDNAENSRAGLFIRNMEPNALNRSAPSIHYMRGPINLARERNMWVLPQWRMEFSVEPQDFFHITLGQASSSLDISRLYYWNPSQTLAGDYEDAMLFCIPLVCSDGTALGICGFEVSNMLFKLQNLPDNSTFSNVFSILGPGKANGLDASCAMFASSHSTRTSLSGTLSVSELSNGFSRFTAEDGTRYVGFSAQPNMYPKNAIHEAQAWVLSILLPEQDYVEHIAARRQSIVFLLAALLLLSLAAALWLSTRYLTPILRAIERIKEQSWNEHERTNIREIDDLIEFLSEQDAHRDAETVPEVAPSEPEKTPSQLFEAFVANIEMLSPAERAVFNLYMEGYTAKEIAEILFLSINTIKTHNRRIYQKLNISSRKELMVYVAMMKEQDAAR